MGERLGEVAELAGPPHLPDALVGPAPGRLQETRSTSCRSQADGSGGIPARRAPCRVSMTWADVPFYIRAGKALARTALEVIVEFQSPPRLLFSAHRCQPDPNFLRFRLGRHDGVSLGVQVKPPGERIVSEPVELDVDFEHALGARQQDYERLLGDALDGDSTRFARGSRGAIGAPVASGDGGSSRVGTS